MEKKKSTIDMITKILQTPLPPPPCPSPSPPPTFTPCYQNPFKSSIVLLLDVLSVIYVFNGDAGVFSCRVHVFVIHLCENSEKQNETGFGPDFFIKTLFLDLGLGLDSV